MKYGFTLPGRGPLAAPERLGIIARKGEELGFDALLTGDHILVPRHIASTYPYTESGEFPGSGSGESMEQITLQQAVRRNLVTRLLKCSLPRNLLPLPSRDTEPQAAGNIPPGGFD